MFLLDCNCNATGSVNLQCKSNGSCACKDGYTGTKCEQLNLGVLDLTVTPESASLFINQQDKVLGIGGKFTQKFPINTRIVIYVKNDGYKPKDMVVTISANTDDNKYEIILQKQYVSFFHFFLAF